MTISWIQLGERLEEPNKTKTYHQKKEPRLVGEKDRDEERVALSAYQ